MWMLLLCSTSGQHPRVKPKVTESIDFNQVVFRYVAFRYDVIPLFIYIVISRHLTHRMLDKARTATDDFPCANVSCFLSVHHILNAFLLRQSRMTVAGEVWREASVRFA